MATSTTNAAPVRRTPAMTPARALVAMARPSQIALIWVVYAAGVLLGLTRPDARAEIWNVLLASLLITGAAVAAHLVNEAEDATTDRLTARTAFELQLADSDTPIPGALRVSATTDADLENRLVGKRTAAAHDVTD